VKTRNIRCELFDLIFIKKCDTKNLYYLKVIDRNDIAKLETNLNYASWNSKRIKLINVIHQILLKKGKV